jgi:YHS domain-containing protein
MMSFDTLVTLALFAGAFFLMTRFGCGGHALGHAHGHGGSVPDSVRDAGSGSRPLVADGDVDPVCGMTVDRASAKSAFHEGRVYYFCSQTCREKFEAAPATYANTASAALHGSEHRHGCC